MKWELTGSWREPQIFDDPDTLAAEITGDSDYISEMEPSEDSVFDFDGRVEVCGIDYWPSEIIKAVDEERYNEMMDEERRYMAESNQNEIARELEMMSYGEEQWYPGNMRVKCIRDEEDDEDDEIEENEDLVEILDYVV